MMNEILSIANKEFKAFFSSPAAYLFLGAFVGTTLFVVFWVETFFARNIADIRPLFQWFPLLLIFLVAALTMRSWSEERRSGTLESLLTAPVHTFSLILGKFFAALALVVLALALTLPLPVTISFLGQIDWGPVLGGYIATFFLAAAYISIGIYTSGRTDNPIVALIMTTIVCGLFYIIGAQLLTNLFSYEVAAILNQFGTGTRFESITRGVIDLRDLVYYLTIVAIFLTLNYHSLEKLRWDGKSGNKRHRDWSVLIWLIVLNCFVLNIWLYTVSWARIDITEDSLYSLSDTTKSQLNDLREPLVIRGYFSERSHPLLTPLVPKIKDLLSEYEMVSSGKVRVEFIDPQKNRELEEEAASKYSIRPVPFQTATRHQAEVVNSYFDIVIAYGDQFETLGYADLIEAKASVSESGVDVRLKNPEYAVTRAIRKVVGAFRVGGAPIEIIDDPIKMKFYISPTNELPSALLPVREDLVSIANELKKEAPNKFSFVFEDPNQDDDLVEILETKYNVKAQVGNLLDPKPFWFSVFVESGKNIQQVQFVQSLEKLDLKKAIDSSLKRLAPGFLRTVAVVTPDGSTQTFNRLKQVLSENLKVTETDLKDGEVPEDSDMLLLLAPNKINDIQLKAIDQFLMKGGSIVIASSPFNVQVGQSIKAEFHTSGLESWLENLGYEIEAEMVLDPQSTSLPVPVQRYIGGIPVREIQLVPYPHFPDIRNEGISNDHPISSSLSQMTLNWVSPISIDDELIKNSTYSALFKSSNSSWTSEELEVIPDLESYPDTGFSIEGERGSKMLAIAASGPFDSYFKDLDDSEEKIESDLIKSSPLSSRLVLIASNSFAADGSIDIASHSLGTLYTKPLEFIQNAIEWSIEDQGLSSLRGRSQFARTLLPMSEIDQQKWEIANYILALFGLLTVWFWRRNSFKRDQIRYKKILTDI